jgi:hypothetical protein
LSFLVPISMWISDFKDFIGPSLVDGRLEVEGLLVRV